MTTRCSPPRSRRATSGTPRGRRAAGCRRLAGRPRRQPARQRRARPRWARRALERVEQNGWTDWRLASCYEGMARAESVAGNGAEARTLGCACSRGARDARRRGRAGADRLPAGLDPRSGAGAAPGAADGGPPRPTRDATARDRHRRRGRHERGPRCLSARAAGSRPARDAGGTRSRSGGLLRWAARPRGAREAAGAGGPGRTVVRERGPAGSPGRGTGLPAGA